MENQNQNEQNKDLAVQPTETGLSAGLSSEDLSTLMDQSIDLDKRKTSVNISPEYFEFAKTGTKVRGVLFGFMPINVKDKTTDELREIDAVAWVLNKRVYLNAGVNLVNQFKKLNLPKGTAVEIEFVEKDGDVKKYSISLLS